MNVRIRPGGIALFILALAALIYRLLYTLLWEQENDKGPLMRFLPKTATVAASPNVSPSAAANAPKAAAAPKAANAPGPVPATAKPLTDWVVLGPIPLPRGAPAIELDRIATLLDMDALPDESHLRPRRGETVRVRNANLRWVTAKDTNLNLVKLAQESADKPDASRFVDVVGYAVTTVEMPNTVKNATLYVGSDDGVAIWLNGVKIHRKVAARGIRVGDDKLTGLSLIAGQNTLVFKVAQGGGDWGVAASLDTH